MWDGECSWLMYVFFFFSFGCVARQHLYSLLRLFYADLWCESCVMGFVDGFSFFLLLVCLFTSTIFIITSALGVV